ncbi:Polypeptide N-acetylgalactosaminyltransferase 9 [Saguinus oedipus]|uniref:Polypeptide N-acetylgalactosaminyltransferase 9 n=1 Tax=Saguinus oedipus TaxID=9490 RepID=A0ABQ9V1Z5_SAGOE|nr:Polypeptide N-acetylgalactosaminyltransferase 9 [Saguinus oedipus]
MSGPAGRLAPPSPYPTWTLPGHPLPPPTVSPGWEAPRQPLTAICRWPKAARWGGPGLDAAHAKPRWSCPQLVRYSADGLLQLGPLGSTAFLPDSKCLVDDGRGRTPTLKKCEDVARPAQRLWDFTQSGPIVSRATGRCLEVEMAKDANFGLRLVVQRCSGQKWMIRNWVKHTRH